MMGVWDVITLITGMIILKVVKGHVGQSIGEGFVWPIRLRTSMAESNLRPDGQY